MGLPLQAYAFATAPILIVVGGLALMLGLRRLCTLVVGAGILLAIITPAISSASMDFSHEPLSLPGWIIVTVTMIAALWAVRLIVWLFFGRDVATFVVAQLISLLIVAPFRALAALIRAAFR